MPARSSSPGRRAPEFAGQTLDAIAAKLKCGLEDAAKQLLPAGAIYFMMSEDDVRRVLSYPHTMIGSDGLPHDEHPHPRLWGTFPRVLGHYVRDVKLFPLEEAVRRMTALPAAQFGLKDRGACAPAPTPTWCCSIRTPSPTPRPSSSRRRPPPASSASWSTAARSGTTALATGERPGRALRRGTLGPMGGMAPH